MLEIARQEALHRFAAHALGSSDVAIERASADASFRSYWRVHLSRELGRAGAPSYIVMNAPPEREDLAPWLDITGRLRAAGLNSPEVLAADRVQGFVLMSDLGTRLYLPALSDATVDALYGDALAALYTMQTRVDAEGLPAYDEARLRAELELYPLWFLARHLGRAPAGEDAAEIESTFALLLARALEQPRTFVHRDYHSRNLLIVEGSNPGIVDFQDAVLGPVSYDLVSLLRDCYIAWPRERVLAWAESHRQCLRQAGLIDADAQTFRRWFDWMGLQRHLKVLGIFCRLWYRDGKAGYLGDLPLVLRYTLEVADDYPEFAGFARRLRAAVGSRDITRPAPP